MRQFIANSKVYGRLNITLVQGLRALCLINNNYWPSNLKWVNFKTLDKNVPLSNKLSSVSGGCDLYVGWLKMLFMVLEVKTVGG